MTTIDTIRPAGPADEPGTPRTVGWCYRCGYDVGAHCGDCADARR